MIFSKTRQPWEQMDMGRTQECVYFGSWAGRIRILFTAEVLLLEYLDCSMEEFTPPGVGNRDRPLGRSKIQWRLCET